jgi:hypothetical protein
MRRLAAFAPSIAVFLIAAAITISGYTNLRLAVALAALGLLLLLIPAWTSMPKLRSAFAGIRAWRFQWPLTREPKAFSPQRFFHCRCMANFGNLGTDNYFTVTIVFFNSTGVQVVVDSIDGHLTYPGLTPEAPIPLSWATANTLAAQPYSWGAVDIRQQVPTGAVTPILDGFGAQRPFAVDLTGVRIRIRSQRPGETLALKLWDGVTCGWPALPTPIGQIVYVGLHDTLHASATLS